MLFETHLHLHIPSAWHACLSFIVAFIVLLVCLGDPPLAMLGSVLELLLSYYRLALFGLTNAAQKIGTWPGGYGHGHCVGVRLFSRREFGWI